MIRTVWKTGIIVILLFASIVLLLNAFSTPQSSRSQTQTASNPDVSIYWLTNSSISASTFPIAFYSTIDVFNLSFSTSWGDMINKSIDYSSTYAPFPDIMWIDLPNSSSGAGNVSIYINNSLENTYPITWQKNAQISQEPEKITLVFNWYSFWVGATELIAEFTKTSVHISHTVLRRDSVGVEGMPYNNNFDFKDPFSESEWQLLTNYLIANNSINWQSWDLKNWGIGMCDGGGFRFDVTIDWNDSLSTKYSQERDDDSCSGKRTFCLPQAAIFNELLLEKTNKIISQHNFTKIAIYPAIATPIVFAIGVIFIKYARRARKAQ
ncbi:MAG: hypothetical protein ACFFBD_08300 [Candidatus Hodarchaeota archaeon]